MIRVGVVAELVAVDPGLWCHDCQLPSGVRLHFVWHLHVPWPRMEMATQLRCHDCGGDRVEDV